MVARKSGEIPVTKNYVDKFRDELKADNASLRLEMMAGFEKVDGKLTQVDSDVGNLKSDIRVLKSDVSVLKSDVRVLKSDMSGLKSEVAGLKSEVSMVGSKVEAVFSVVHRIQALVEEQNAKNNFVLDGHTNLNDRMDRFESETDKRFSDIERVIEKSGLPSN